MSTYCPRLWREVFIKEQGEVYACCHDQPRKLGNINDNKLEDIYNGDVWQSIRRKSLNGTLLCYKVCNLLKPEEFENPVTGLTAPYNTLKRIKIQIGQNCNINCIMCYQNKDKRNNPSIDIDLLKNQVDFSPFDVVDIQGGEPLFIQSGRELFDHAASLGKKVSIVTNGLVLNRQWAEKIVNHSKLYHVSLNAATKPTHELVNKGSRWDVVLKHITLLRELKEQEKSDIKIKGHFTIIKENCQEIPLFIEQYKNFGFDCIDFGYDLRFPFYLLFRPIFKKRLKTEINQALDCVEDWTEIDSSRLEHLGLVVKKNQQFIRDYQLQAHT